MGKLWDRYKEQRKERRADLMIDRAKAQARREKLKDIYDKEFERGAVSAVKSRARREGKARYAQKQSVLRSIGSGLEQFGNWAAGNQPKRASPSSGSRRRKKGKRRRGGGGSGGDPFPDMNFDLGSL